MRYFIGISFLYNIGMYGEDIIFWAIIIGLFYGFIDNVNNNPPINPV